MKTPLPRRLLALLLGAILSGSSRAQNAADGFNPDVNGTVRAIAFTADGRCLIGGDFTSVGGVSRNRLARILPDGSVDPDFNPGANGAVNTIAVQSDGRILAGGQFTTAGGLSRTGLVRLNANGSVDESFSPVATGGAVLALAVQADGRILTGGQFTALAGLAQPALGRLNPDGSADPDFAATLDGSVKSLTVLRDGNIVAAGTFTTSGGAATNGLVRLRPDGATDFRYPTDTGAQVHAVGAWPDGSVTAAMTIGSLNRVCIFPLAGPQQSFPITGTVHSLAVQGDGMVMAGGNFTAAAGQPRSNLFRYSRTGNLDALATLAAGEVHCIAIQQDGKIAAGGNFTTIGGVTRNRLARMYPDGKMDRDFNPGSNAFALSGNGNLNLVAQQPDSLLLAGGFQHTLADQTRIGLGRLYMDGTLDAPFNPNAGPPQNVPSVDCAVVQEDGKIIVGGQFTSIGGLSRQKIARLNPDGTADAAFSADLSSAAPAMVRALAIQKDGKILVGGRFDQIGSVTKSGIARLNVDGSVDTSFGISINQVVETIAVQGDGKILYGGSLGTGSGPPGSYIGRLNPNGTRDTSFMGSADSHVYCLAVQSDGKILVGGNFERLAGAPKYHLGRLNADGTLDTTFDAPPGGDFTQIYSISVQANGFIIVSGAFTSIKGTPRNQLVRLSPDSAVDSTWNPNAGSSAYIASVGLMDDGKCIVGGNFSKIGDQSRRNIGRISNRDAALQRLELNTAGDALNWQRGGSAPEASETIFEISADGTNFTRLGSGSRVGGGWSCSANSLLEGSFLIRARARVPGGTQNGCTGLIETQRLVHRAPEIGVRSGDQDYYSLQATSLDFGISRTGNPVERSVTLSNSGNAPLNVSSLALAPGYVLEGIPTLPFAIEPSGSRTFQIRMTALLPGTFTGHLTLQSNDGDEAAFALPLSGTVITPEISVHDGTAAVPPGIADGATAPIDFGVARQATPVSRPFTLANSGTAPLIIRGLSAPEGFAWLNLPAIPFQLAPGETRTFQLSLLAEALGDFQGVVVVDNDDDDESLFDFTVSGKVVTPEIAVHTGPTSSAPELSSGQTTPVSFGRVVQASPAVQALYIANGGTAPLRVESVELPAGYEAGGLPDMPFLIEPGAGTAFEIRLTSLIPEVYEGNAVIRSDDLDEAAFTFPLAGEIYIPDPEAALAGTTTQLNRQTGLREQILKLSNPTTATVPAYEILIRGLPPGVQVYNASTVREDGTVVITILRPMLPFSELEVIIEYYSVDRLPVELNPQITTAVILSPPAPLAGDGNSFKIDRMLRLPEGGMLIEFTSQPGQVYEVEYSSDGTQWRSCGQQIRAAGNRVQWIDRGPPFTDSLPSAQASRFYRIRELSR